MSGKDDQDYLIHIRERIARIEAYTQDGHAAFFASPLQQDAVIYNIEIIGEATRLISEELKQCHPQVSWQDIEDSRFMIIRQYMEVDLDKVWRVVEQDLPKLKVQVGELLEHMDSRP